MDISRGHMTSTKSSSNPFVDNGALYSGCSHLDNRTRNGNCRLLPNLDTMDEKARNSLNWEEFFGSSLELAPSLLNLYDHRIASGARGIDKSGEKIIELTATKALSLQTKTSGSPVDRSYDCKQRILSQKLPVDQTLSLMDTEQIISVGAGAVDDNKKRPLSISSVSSTSLTSSPRLRKKRANTFNGWDVGVVQETCLDSQATLVNHCDADPRLLQALESRNSVDIDCVYENKYADRCFDSMSVTSSENGSFRDEVDASGKDYPALYPSHPDRLNFSNITSTSSNDSTIQSPSLESRIATSRSDLKFTASNHSPLSSTPKKQIRPIISSDYQHNCRSFSEPNSPVGNLSQIENDTSYGENISGRSSSFTSRHDARMRFFSNYEDHVMSSTLQAPIAEEDFEILPSPNSRSLKDSLSFSNSSHETASLTTVTRTPYRDGSPSRQASQEKTKPVVATASNSEHRRERSSQLSPTSEKTKRADRAGSVSKNDRQSTSPRSGLARTSKKRDPLTSPDSGSRSSPVYASYVSKVVMEIIESERTYIASLENIIHGYLEPMEKMLNSSAAKEDIMCLFSNIREIYKFGCVFLSDLETAGADPVKVAQCFVKYNKGFVIYTDYCTNYPRAVEVLTRFMQHPDLSQLCKERQLALGHGLPLGAYLLKPVQRILKYHLLLHNIVKNCEKEKEEAAILEQAFLHMTRMAHHINEMKRKHEHAVRIQEIQSQLEDYVGEDLTRLGELVLEGSFKVSGAKASRQVFLFERGILISKMKEGGMLSCKTFIQCSNLMLVEVIPNEPLSFHIIPFDNPRAQDTLQARNMEQKLRWCHDIKKQILESFKGIPDNAKNLIMQLGRDHDDDYISREVIDAGRRNQHMAPEYLEKRRFRRKSAPRLPDFRLLKPQKTKKGTNKKNESKTGEKISVEIIRRSESKSPEGHINLKQNFITKRRSHSTSSSTVLLSSLRSTNLYDQSSADSNNDISWPITKIVGHSSPNQECRSPDSPGYRKSPNKFTYSKAEIETEAEITKRPASFLMARANPILLEDVTQLLARCEGSKKIQTSLLLEEDKENKLSMLTDFTDMGRLSFKSQSDMEKVVDTEQKVYVDENERAKNKSKFFESSLVVEEIQSLNSSENISVLSETEVSTHTNNLHQNVMESRRPDLKSISLPDLNKTADLKEVFGKFEKKSNGSDIFKNRATSQSEKDVYESDDNTSKSRIRMSRKDMQYVGQSFRRKGKTEDSNNDIERQKKESEIINIDNANKKSANDYILLRKTGLRLPNTLQLLATKKYEPHHHTNEVRSKLVDNSEEITQCSVDNWSHRGENSWIIDSVNVSSGSSMDIESLNSFKHSLSTSRRPRGHSDITDMIQVSNTKETVDLLHRNSVSALPHSYSAVRDNLQIELKLSSQVPYATPPRGYLTMENMKKLGSFEDSDRTCFLYQDIKGTSVGNSVSGAIKPFGISPVTVTVAKPVSFSTSNLLRSNSTPNTSERPDFTIMTTSKGRPVSMDVDKLTEESNRLVAEMEEYISSSYENMKSTNKFPTSLSAIPVEEEAGSNRLSVVSSISTSSYESQDSNSSDGLIRTLKSKLRAWARMRNDSEFSYASSFTSDDEDLEEPLHSEYCSALGFQIKDSSSCSNNGEPGTVLLEHDAECLESVSYMTDHLTHQPTEEIISHYCAEFYDNELHPHGKFYFDSVDISSEKSDEFPLAEKHLVQAQLSSSSISETDQVLFLDGFDNFDIENSHSKSLFKSTNINTLDLTPLTNEDLLKSEIDLLPELNVMTGPVSTSFLNTETANENSNLNKDDSLTLLNSDNSGERNISSTSDSEIMKKETQDCDHSLQKDVESELPRKSIREYVQVFEKMQRVQSQRVLEVRRKEPGDMIRQRLETLRESALHGWRSSSNSSSRPASEERDFMHSKSPPTSHSTSTIKLPFTIDNNNPRDSSIRSIYANLLDTRDSLSKSVENLSKSWESIYLSRSRDSLNSISDIPGNRHSVPSFSPKSNSAGHEKDATRFHYKSSEANMTSSGNQFIHRAHTSSGKSNPLSEASSFMATEDTPMESSRSMCQLSGLDTDVDSLVVMKGWVRALISKFQDK